MGKAIVSTPAGIHGLELSSGRDVLVAADASAFAGAIRDLLAHPERRRAIEAEARASVERLYDWDVIAARQREMYRGLIS